MTEAFEDGSCFRVEKSTEGTTMVLTEQWDARAADRLRSGEIDRLDLNYVKGFKNTDLRFIEDWPLRHVSVVARTVTDLSPLERLNATLESLALVTDESAQLDLGAFPTLTRLAAAWAQVDGSIGEGAGLVDLYLGAFRPEDLTCLRRNPSLRKLRMKDRPRLKSLDGIEHLPELEELGVFGAPALTDIAALELTGESTLTGLQLESCRSIGDWSPIAACRGVQLLNASECGPIPSLKPLSTMSDLRYLWMWGSTRIVDDDLTPLRELEQLAELRMKDRKTYVPTVERIKDGLARRLDGQDSART